MEEEEEHQNLMNWLKFIGVSWRSLNEGIPGHM
jgi:hypothetical protein